MLLRVNENKSLLPGANILWKVFLQNLLLLHINALHWKTTIVTCQFLHVFLYRAGDLDVAQLATTGMRFLWYNTLMKVSHFHSIPITLWFYLYRTSKIFRMFSRPVCSFIIALIGQVNKYNVFVFIPFRINRLLTGPFKKFQMF